MDSDQPSYDGGSDTGGGGGRAAKRLFIRGQGGLFRVFLLMSELSEEFLELGGL